MTDSKGHYRFDSVDTDNFYTVTPGLQNYSFSRAGGGIEPGDVVARGRLEMMTTLANLERRRRRLAWTICHQGRLVEI